MRVQRTARDELMLAWLSEVRVAGMEAIQYALAGFAGTERPVSLRVAQLWAKRLASVGLVGRTRVDFRAGAIVWATSEASGKPAPNLFRQTTRHEVTVAGVSARYLSKGFIWARDRKAVGWLDHQADGIAAKSGWVDLVEVELSPKTPTRYKTICENHAFRLAHEGVDRVLYLCTSDAARTVTREADRYLFRDLRPRLEVLDVFDARGNWVGDSAEMWRHRGRLPMVLTTGAAVLEGIDELDRVEP